MGHTEVDQMKSIRMRNLHINAVFGAAPCFIGEKGELAEDEVSDKDLKGRKGYLRIQGLHPLRGIESLDQSSL